METQNLQGQAMNQAEQTALISIMIMCGAVAAAHIIAALYLIRRAEKKAGFQQDISGWDIPNKNQELSDLIASKIQQHQEKKGNLR